MNRGPPQKKPATMSKEQTTKRYLYVSAMLFLVFATSNSLTAIALTLANLANALRLAYKYIPNFGQEE